LKNKPITCFCPTYLRSPYPLEEALWCFLQQDYEGDMELFISNDDPDVKLVFDHPQVTIRNHPRRFLTVYDKINTDRMDTKYELIMPWPDDDLYAPWAARIAVKYWEKNRYPYVAFKHHYKMHPNGFAKMEDIVPGVVVMTKSAWRECGGFPVNIMMDTTKQVGNDRLVHHILKSMDLYGEQTLEDEDIYFCWRFSKSFKWKRNNWSNKDEEKFKIKPREPEIIELKPKLSTEFLPFGYR